MHFLGFLRDPKESIMPFVRVVVRSSCVITVAQLTSAVAPVGFLNYARVGDCGVPGNVCVSRYSKFNRRCLSKPFRAIE